jgi:hypothetical protein
LRVDSASATTISYTGYSWIGDDIQILVPNNIYGGAGQITLDTANGPVLAWCLDVSTYLLSQATYSVGTPATVSLNATQTEVIASLIVEGNTLLAGSGVSGYNKNDISAAVQVAIWEEEYGASFNYQIDSSSLTSTQFSGLVADFLSSSTTDDPLSYTNYLTRTYLKITARRRSAINAE